jgi:hypothetical protein
LRERLPLANGKIGRARPSCGALVEDLTGSYSTGKARRIPPQLIQKVEQALLDSVPVGWPAIRKVWSAVSVDDKSANALIELRNKLNTSAFAPESRTNPKLKSEGD